jgi:hypothetical protein
MMLGYALGPFYIPESKDSENYLQLAIVQLLQCLTSINWRDVKGEKLVKG